MNQLEAQNALVCVHDSWSASKYHRLADRRTSTCPAAHSFIQTTRTKDMTQQGYLLRSHAVSSTDRDLRHTLHSDGICVAKRVENLLKSSVNGGPRHHAPQVDCLCRENSDETFLPLFRRLCGLNLQSSVVTICSTYFHM